MKLNFRASLVALVSALNLTTASPKYLAANDSIAPQTTAVVADPSNITQIWATTFFFVSCGFFAPAPTLYSTIAITTLTTIQPVATAYPATIVQTVISNETNAEHRYSSAGESDWFSISSGVSTLAPRTTVLLAAPEPTPFVTPKAIGSVCSCPAQTHYNNFTTDIWPLCTTIWCCLSTESGDLFGLLYPVTYTTIYKP